VNGEVVTAVLFAVDDDYLRALSPKMTVAEFSARVASAFFLWPKELLESELNRNGLASPDAELPEDGRYSRRATDAHRAAGRGL
jgi:hypothetical protein